jgi:hypothetical protein
LLTSDIVHVKVSLSLHLHLAGGLILKGRDMLRSTVLAVFSLALLLGVVPGVIGGTITYDFVDYPNYQNGYNISGYVTTDGFIGIASQPGGASHILSFSLTVTQGGATVETISSSTGGLFQTNNDGFILTPTSILPYLSGPNQSGGIALRSSSGFPLYGNAGFASTNQQITLFYTGQFSSLWDRTIPGDSNPIATVASVPEPGCLTLALAGVAAMAWAGWRRRRAAATLPTVSEPIEA